MVIGIEMANDNAKTKIGSYRVDPNGNQKTKEVCCENKIYCIFITIFSIEKI